jgi:hypothetical protein
MSLISRSIVHQHIGLLEDTEMGVALIIWTLGVKALQSLHGRDIEKLKLIDSKAITFLL